VLCSRRASFPGNHAVRDAENERVCIYLRRWRLSRRIACLLRRA